MHWKVTFFRSESENEPVAEFFDSLSIADRAKVTRSIKRLAENGILLKEPFSKQIKGKIRELRIQCKDKPVRVLYFTFTERTFVLLHGFIKKSQKTPRKEVNLAVKRMNECLDML